MPKNAPGPAPGVLSCPAHLTGMARERWHLAAAWMTSARTIGAECAGPLERYAVAYGRWRLCEEKLEEGGLMLEAAKTGTPYVSPWYYLARSEAASMLRLESELGFGPSARGRVSKLDQMPSDDPGELFMRDRWDQLRVLQGRSGKP